MSADILFMRNIRRTKSLFYKFVHALELGSTRCGGVRSRFISHFYTSWFLSVLRFWAINWVFID